MLNEILTKPSILGLILDILGAFYLAKSFINKSVNDLKAESWGDDNLERGYPGGMSENQFISFYKQSIEAKTGFVLLALGFLGQITGYLLPHKHLSWSLGLIILLISFVLPWILHKRLFTKERIDLLAKVGNRPQSIQWRK